MKLTCDMVADLYPLYKDGLASQDTRSSIKEHLRECEDCRHFYRRYPFLDKVLRRSAAGVLTPPVHSGSADDGFRSIAKKMRRNNAIKIAVVSAVTLGLAAFAILKFVVPSEKK